MSLSALVAAAAITAITPVFVAGPCADAQLGAGVRCGTVGVPENRDLANGRTIALKVIVLPATSPAPHLSPLFDIDGGPGYPDTKNAQFYATAGASYRLRRDIVLVDQRGTGGSNPLKCPELVAAEARYEPVYPAAAVVRCRKALEARADLSRYGTRDAVADLDAVRRALDYDRIDLFALSYGTTVALRYLAAYPGRVRAAVLMGTAPPWAMPPRSHAVAAQKALDLLFAQCSADPACGAAFKPAADLDRALARLPRLGHSPPRPVFLEKLRSLMYAPASARRIPMIVHRAAAGDLAPFYEATRPQGPDLFSEGMYLSVTCSESMALMDYGVAAAAARRTRFGDYRLRRQRQACTHWPRANVDADFLKPVSSNAAVLLISGGLDAVTPPEWAERVSRTLPHSRHLVVPDGGHLFDGLSGGDTCFDPLLVSFLDTADVASIDPGCLSRMRPGPFATSPESGRGH